MTDKDGFVEVDCSCAEHHDNCECDHEGVCECEHVDDTHGFADSIHATLDQASRDLRNAVTSGMAAAEPVFRNKVAPALAQASAKLSDMSTTAQKSTTERAGLDDDVAPSEQIQHGLASIAAGLLGLSRSLADWVHEHATHAATVETEHVTVVDEPVVSEKVDVVSEPVTVDENVTVVTKPVASDVDAISDLLQTPVVVFDGDTEVVEPN